MRSTVGPRQLYYSFFIGTTDMPCDDMGACALIFKSFARASQSNGHEAGEDPSFPDQRHRIGSSCRCMSPTLQPHQKSLHILTPHESRSLSLSLSKESPYESLFQVFASYSHAIFLSILVHRLECLVRGSSVFALGDQQPTLGVFVFPVVYQDDNDKKSIVGASTNVFECTKG